MKLAVKDGKKFCSACQQNKPVADFYYVMGYPNGTCKVCRRSAAKKRYRENPEFRQKKIDHARAYYAQHHREINIDRAVKGMMNRTKLNERKAVYRARRRDADVGDVDYAAILKRDGLHCYLCDSQVEANDVSFDHVIPLSRGGEHSMANIKVTHLECNLRKRSRLVSELSGSFST